MEHNGGKELESMIGIGRALTGEAGPIRSIYDDLPSYLASVMDIFKEYPVYEEFGLRLNDAMDLPIDRWRKIAKAVVLMGPKVKPKAQDSTDDLLQLIVELLKVRGGD